MKNKVDVFKLKKQGIVQKVQHASSKIGAKFVVGLDKMVYFAANRYNNTSLEVVKYAKSPILFGFWVFLVFIVLGFGWAAFAPLDSAAHAVGFVVSETAQQSIQAYKNGMVRKCFVKQGDIVVKNQVLIELSDTEMKARYEYAMDRYLDILASKNNYTSQRDNKSDIVFDQLLLDYSVLPRVAKILDIQRNIFIESQQHRHKKNVILRKKIDQALEQQNACKAKIKSAQDHLSNISEQLYVNKQLEKEGFVSKSACTEIKARNTEAQYYLNNAKAESINKATEIQSLSLELSSYNHDCLCKILTGIEEQNTKLLEAHSVLVSTEEQLKSMYVRSPIDGVVNYITKDTHLGSSATGGLNVADITPKDNDLAIEVKISNEYIDMVQVGQETKVKITAFKSKSSPTFSGTLISLSPNIAQAQHQIPFYTAHLGINKQYYTGIVKIKQEQLESFLQDNNLKLVTGMAADVQIVTGQRTLLRYLLDPFLDRVFKAFKEK